MDNFKKLTSVLFSLFLLSKMYKYSRPYLTKLLIKKILKVFIKKREKVKNEDWKIIEPNLNRNLSKKIVYYFIPGNFKNLLKQSDNKQLIDLKLNSESVLFLFMNRFIRNFDEEWKDETHFLNEIKKYEFVYNIPNSNSLKDKNNRQIILSSKEGLEYFFNDIVGIHLFDVRDYNKDSILYEFDMNFLKNINHKKNHLQLGGNIFLKLENKKIFLSNANLNVNELKKLLSSFLIINNLGYHANLHVFSNNFNLFLKKNLDLNNSVMRFLSYIRLEPYGVNEVAVITLLSKAGFEVSTNLSEKGIYDLLNYFDNPYEKLLNPAFVFKNIKNSKGNYINEDNIFDSIYDRLPDNSIHKYAIKWWDIIYSYSKSFFIHSPKSDLEIFLNILKKSDYKYLINEEEDILINVSKICAKILYMCIAHEMMSNSNLCKLASNPFILPTTIRKNKEVPNVISTLRAASLWNSINMPSARLCDYKWREIISRNDKELECIKLFENNVKEMNDDSNILYYQNIETSIRW